MFSSLLNVPIRYKISGAITLLMLISSIISGIALTGWLSSVNEKDAIETLQKELLTVKKTVEMYDKNARIGADRLFASFISSLSTDVSKEDAKKIEVGGKSTPALKIGASFVNGDFSAVDKFSQIYTGSVATIFVKDGDDFIRVSTSLKKKMERGR